MKPSYSVVHGHMMYKQQLVIPTDSIHIPLILQECHNSMMGGGHSGVLKTLKRIQASIYWIGMRQTVQNYVVHYHVC